MDNAEESKWELSPYELHRKPSEVFVGDIEIATTPENLHGDFTCPICLGILKNTMTAKECLHRFCAYCIITSLRNANKECPTCRNKLPSKRSLRYDHNFDTLISMIYQNLEQYETEHEKTIAEFNASYAQTLPDNLRAMILKNKNKQEEITISNSKEENKPNIKRHKYSTRSASSSNVQDLYISDSEMNPENTDTNVDIIESEIKEVELILNPHASMEAMKDDKARYIKTTATATVDHFKKYLLMRLFLDRDSDVSGKLGDSINLTLDNVHLHATHTTSDTINLDGSRTLEELVNTYGKNDQPLEIFYSFA